MKLFLTSVWQKVGESFLGCKEHHSNSRIIPSHLSKIFSRKVETLNPKKLCGSTERFEKRSILINAEQHRNTEVRRRTGKPFKKISYFERRQKRVFNERENDFRRWSSQFLSIAIATSDDENRSLENKENTRCITQVNEFTGNWIKQRHGIFSIG